MFNPRKISDDLTILKHVSYPYDVLVDKVDLPKLMYRRWDDLFYTRIWGVRYHITEVLLDKKLSLHPTPKELTHNLTQFNLGVWLRHNNPTQLELALPLPISYAYMIHQNQ